MVFLTSHNNKFDGSQFSSLFSKNSHDLQHERLDFKQLQTFLNLLETELL